MIDLEKRRIEIASQFTKMILQDLSCPDDREDAIRMWTEAFVSGLVMIIHKLVLPEFKQELLHHVLESIQKHSQEPL